MVSDCRSAHDDCADSLDVWSTHLFGRRRQGRGPIPRQLGRRLDFGHLAFRLGHRGAQAPVGLALDARLVRLLGARGCLDARRLAVRPMFDAVDNQEKTIKN